MHQELETLKEGFFSSLKQNLFCKWLVSHHLLRLMKSVEIVAYFFYILKT